MEPIEEMLDRLTMPIAECGCHVWLGDHNAEGYARASSPRGGTKSIARLAYERVNGKIPEGLEIDHLCNKRWCSTNWCVNPDHLEAVTHQENVRRYWSWFVPKEFCDKHPDVRLKRTTRAYVCRVCSAEYLRGWRARNPDYDRKYQQANSDRIKAQGIVRRAKAKESLR